MNKNNFIIQKEITSEFPTSISSTQNEILPISHELPKRLYLTDTISLVFEEDTFSFFLHSKPVLPNCTAGCYIEDKFLILKNCTQLYIFSLKEVIQNNLRHLIQICRISLKNFTSNEFFYDNSFYAVNEKCEVMCIGSIF